MKRSLTFGVLAAALAPVFNRLMGLNGTEFAGSGRAQEPSPAQVRAEKRLAAHRAQWADTPDTSVWTRQRRRAAERRAAKGRVA